jgi:signal transduction histidine kinase
VPTAQGEAGASQPLSNALKFTPEGGRIDVALPRSTIAVEVVRCGHRVGIAPEDQDAVFEEFRQVGGVRRARRRHRARPCDLAQVHRAARRPACGSQRARKGSTFTFSLPLQGE